MVEFFFFPTRVESVRLGIQRTQPAELGRVGRAGRAATGEAHSFTLAKGAFASSQLLITILGAV